MRFCLSIPEFLILKGTACLIIFILSNKCKIFRFIITTPKRHLIILHLAGPKVSEYFGTYLVFTLLIEWTKNVGLNISLSLRLSLEFLEWSVECADICKVFVYLNVIMVGFIIFWNKLTMKGFIWWLLWRWVNQLIWHDWVF